MRRELGKTSFSSFANWTNLELGSRDVVMSTCRAAAPVNWVLTRPQKQQRAHNASMQVVHSKHGARWQYSIEHAKKILQTKPPPPPPLPPPLLAVVGENT